MNRELADVRRYWPKAKYAGLRMEEKPYREFAFGRWCSMRGYLSGGYVVSMVSRYIWPLKLHPTIAEAMRAAGFGQRVRGECAGNPAKRKHFKPGRRKHFFSAYNAEGDKRIVLIADKLVDRQRPYHGARFGRMKRRRYREV